MRVRVTTTITTDIDVVTLEPSHSVEIVGEDGLPESVVRAAAMGGLRSALHVLDEGPDDV